MHTKRQIEQLLESAGVRPNRHLGQHFLIDLNLMRLLIETADINKNDVVLEVGCGTGSLTEAIAERCGRCVAVEMDAILAQIAATQSADKPGVEIIAADVLKNKFTVNPAVSDALNRARAKCTGRLLLVSNLPYSAATPLMLNLIGGTPVVDAMFVTVQKEVADRMIAQAGTKDYGILSIVLALTGDVKIIRVLKPSVFWPRPQVNSAMISYVRNEKKAGLIKSISFLSEVVSMFMQHRRKMLKGCTKYAGDALADISDWTDIFRECSVKSDHRPDQIEPNEYLAIANLCRERLSRK